MGGHMKTAWILLLAITGTAISASAIAGNKSSLKLENIAQSTLQFIANSQVEEEDGVYVPGEWKAQVSSSLFSVILGVGTFHGEEEPSAFTTGSIMNQLAMIYLDYPQYSQIPAMINKALPSLDRFREGDLYNFYPPKMWRGVRVHQAATMSLAPAWKGFTNIPEDADTSSVSHTAHYFADKLSGKSFVLPTSVTDSYSLYRDLNRSAHKINNKQRMINTGAFLTWQYDENNPEMPRKYYAGPEEGKRIPFNKNDVDCVVNLNVLRLLALTGHSNIEGRDQSCGLMAYIILSKEYARCGMYYPNTYYFHYTASAMDQAGENCLRPYKQQMVDFILETQKADGGWYNIENKYGEDRIHATAFALHGLAQFGDTKDDRVREALENGSSYLRSRLQRSSDGLLYWPGEIFFTATGVARSLGDVNWRSDTFTTVVSISALLNVQQALSAKATRN